MQLDELRALIQTAMQANTQIASYHQQVAETLGRDSTEYLYLESTMESLRNLEKSLSLRLSNATEGEVEVLTSG